MNMKSRRKFLRNTGLITGGIITSSFANSSIKPYSKIVGANDRIKFGVIGCKGMGWSDMRSILSHDGTDCIAICDVDDRVLEQRSSDVKKLTGKKPKVYKDYRKLLENKDVDAVVIGTPDHWHCLMLVHALEAGKHIYC